MRRLKLALLVGVLGLMLLIAWRPAKADGPQPGDIYDQTWTGATLGQWYSVNTWQCGEPTYDGSSWKSAISACTSTISNVQIGYAIGGIISLTRVQITSTAQFNYLETVDTWLSDISYGDASYWNTNSQRCLYVGTCNLDQTDLNNRADKLTGNLYVRAWHDSGGGPSQIAITSIRVQGVWVEVYANPGGGGGAVAVGCQLCTYAPTGDLANDAPRLIEYLLCGFSNIYYCTVVPILLGIWQSIVNLIVLIQSITYYMIDSARAISIWMNGNITTVVRYASGYTDNAVTRIVNGGIANTTIISTGGSGSNLFDVLIELFRQLGNIVITTVKAIPQIVNAVRDSIGTLGNVIITLGFLLVTIATMIINLLIVLLAQLLRLANVLPALLNAFVDGFSGAVGSSPLMAAPGADVASKTLFGQSCNQDAIYPLCLGAYVLDNTLFANIDPANPLNFVNLIRALYGLASWGLLWFFISKMRNAFTNK